MGTCPLARGGGSDATSRQSRRSLKWHAQAKISRRSESSASESASESWPRPVGLSPAGLASAQPGSQGVRPEVLVSAWKCFAVALQRVCCQLVFRAGNRGGVHTFLSAEGCSARAKSDVGGVRTGVDF